MPIVNVDITTADLAERPISDWFYNFSGDPKYTFKLPVGSLLKITTPDDESEQDIWATPEDRGDDGGPFSVRSKKRTSLPDGQLSITFLVHQVGKADIVLFHEAGSQIVRVYGIPDSRGRTEMRPTFARHDR